MNNTSAFCPGHITGFFRPDRNSSNILEQGSTGAGFCIEAGVTTEVRLADHTEIFINTRNATNSAEVSKTAVRLFNSKTTSNQHYLIYHDIKIPGGSGFGSSAAGAISLLRALNKLNSSPLCETEILELAHIAEIECRTGLGTVAGAAYGGFEIRMSAGAPGTADIRTYNPGEISAQFLINGPLKTSNLLNNPETMNKISTFTKEATEILSADFSVENYLKLAKDFTLNTGLPTPETVNMIEYGKSLGFDCAMLMFGDGIYTLGDSQSLDFFLKKMKEKFNIREHFRSRVYVMNGG